MPHPHHRKPATRRKILAAAARLFDTRGFDATSIDEVMQACGLTRGGFYLHFRSKAQLHHEASALAHPVGADRGAAPTDWVETLFDGCRAVASPGETATGPTPRPQPDPLSSPRPDPFPAARLALDATSSTPEVRQTYARTLEQIRLRVAAEMGVGHDGGTDGTISPDAAPDAALAVTALLVGALTVAHSIDDDSLIAEMTEACRRTAHALRNPAAEADGPQFFWAATEIETTASGHAVH